MPKKYGDVKLSPDKKTLTCRTCGYSWKPDANELNEIQLGHMVSCLNCRAMNGLKAGERVGNNRDFIISHEIGYIINGNEADRLRGNNYLDEEIDVVHLKCRKASKIKLDKLKRNEIECVHCKNAIRVKSSSEIPSKIIGDKQYIVEKSNPNISIGTESYAATKINVGNILENNIRVMDIDRKNELITLQCSRCGLEFTKSINILKTEASRSKYLVCESCKKSTYTDSELIYKLRQRYLGKVYNGLEIEEIYMNKESGAVKCDVACINGMTHTSLKAYISSLTEKTSSSGKTMYLPNNITHAIKNIPLGDVINKRAFCEECGKKKVLDNVAIKNKLQTCPNFSMFRGKGPKIDIEGLTMEQFYKDARHGSLCEYCNMKDKCSLAGVDPRVSLSIFVNELDYNNEILNDILKLTAMYPSLFRFKTEDAEAIKIVGDLIVVKDAYISRNGDIYKVCICKTHGKELILNQSEIANFNHKECIEDSPYMRIYNMPATMYLGSK